MGHQIILQPDDPEPIEIEEDLLAHSYGAGSNVYTDEEWEDMLLEREGGYLMKLAMVWLWFWTADNDDDVNYSM